MVGDFVFLRSPAALELQQTFIFRFGSAKAKGANSVLTAPSDGLPHDKVVRPQVLEMLIRGAVFIDTLFAEVEVDCTGNRPTLIKGEHNKPFARCDDVLENLFEETQRLGWEPVVTASDAV